MTEPNGVSNRTVVGATILLSVLLLLNLGAQWSIFGAIKGVQEAASLTEAHVAALESDVPNYLTGWEYDVVAIPDLEWKTKAQQLGKDGWEIVTARRASGADDSYAYECIVKRRLSEE